MALIPIRRGNGATGVIPNIRREKMFELWIFAGTIMAFLNYIGFKDECSPEEHIILAISSIVIWPVWALAFISDLIRPEK